MGVGFDQDRLELTGEPVALEQGLAIRGELAAYEVSERFYEIGTPSGLSKENSESRNSIASSSECTTTIRGWMRSRCA